MKKIVIFSIFTIIVYFIVEYVKFSSRVYTRLYSTY